jgi:transposase-like protein
MTKGEQARLVAWRLRILQEAAAVANVARVCRRFGLSRKSFYKWKQRPQSTATPGSVTGRMPHTIRRGPPRRRW